jgi:hypothetical protein
MLYMAISMKEMSTHIKMLKQYCVKILLTVTVQFELPPSNSLYKPIQTLSENC